MTFKVVWAEKRHYQGAFKLVQELAEFERAAQEVSNSSNRFSKDAEQNRFKLIVAVNADDEVLGMALFFDAYSTWKGKMLYLDDIVVKEKYRSLGIGKALLDEMLHYAEQNDYQMAKWQVLDWNERAINFYRRYPVIFDKEWIDCKVFKKDLPKS